MKPKFKINFILLLILLNWLPNMQEADAQPRTGFLVLAPDRGFIGNREVEKLFESFAQDYPAALAFVEREYGGPDRTYEQFLREALDKLRKKGLDRVVVISLFLTKLNPVVQEVRGLTVREDWPKKHKKAVEEIRNLIQDASIHGRALIISNRLYGSGRYDEFFEGLDYEMNRKGLALHANMTRWLDEGIRKTLENEFSLP